MLKGRKFLIGELILFLAIAYLAYTGFQASATYYYTVSEFVQQGSSGHGENVRLNGQVASGSVEKESGGLILSFTIIEGGESLPVIYKGIVPDAFKAGSDIVIEGLLDSDGIFQTNTILTKCPSKYVPKE